MGERQEAEDQGWECCKGAVKHDEGRTKAATDFVTSPCDSIPRRDGRSGPADGNLTVIQRGLCSHTPTSLPLGLTYHLLRHRTQPPALKFLDDMSPSVSWHQGRGWVLTSVPG